MLAYAPMSPRSARRGQGWFGFKILKSHSSTHYLWKAKLFRDFEIFNFRNLRLSTTYPHFSHTKTSQSPVVMRNSETRASHKVYIHY